MVRVWGNTEMSEILFMLFVVLGIGEICALMAESDDEPPETSDDDVHGRPELIQRTEDSGITPDGSGDDPVQS